LDISEFLKSYPGVTVATDKDNQDILNFFGQTQIQGRGMSIVYDRTPDFFAFLKLHSPRMLVFIYRGKEGDIQGVATMLFRRGYVNGAEKEICYLGDLRMGFDRKGAVLWRQIYGEFFARKKEIDQLKDVDLFYTCLIDDNELSQRSLARNKKSGFAYHRVCPYSMVTLMLQKPFSSSRENTAALRVLRSPSQEQLQKFYYEHEKPVHAGYLFSTEISTRLKTWPDFAEENFLAVEKDGRLLASAALWSPRSCKKIILSQVPWHLSLFFSLARMFSFGRFRFQGELKVLYVTHLVFDPKLSSAERNEVFRALLKEAWQIRAEQGYHFLSFCDFKESSLLEATGSFIVNRVPMAIHEVTGAQDPVPSQQKEYGFEMALV